MIIETKESILESANGLKIPIACIMMLPTEAALKLFKFDKRHA